MDVKFLKQILQQFNLGDVPYSFTRFTQGYINDTYLIFEEKIPKYVLQRINKNVFKNIEQLQNNIDMALLLLKGDEYSQIQFLKSKAGNSLLNYSNQYWRLMTYIPESKVYDTTVDHEIAFEAGRIVGVFHKLVEHESVLHYHDTLPNFHNLSARLDQFNKALKEANPMVIEKSKEQVNFIRESESLFDKLNTANLPLRVCHNDSKLNNILFDNYKKALCLIDLDTIMPGLFLYDFGDLVRTVVNSCREDEIHLERIDFNINLFEKIVDGIRDSRVQLSKDEIAFLPISVVLMPFIHGLRFLTDFLSEDVYYKVDYKDQNLDRSASLFQFARLAIKNQQPMKNYLSKKLN